MGNNHGKILIEQQQKQAAAMSSCSSPTCAGKFNCIQTAAPASKCSPFAPSIGQNYEQAGASVKKPRLKLKHFFKVADIDEGGGVAESRQRNAENSAEHQQQQQEVVPEPTSKKRRKAKKIAAAVLEVNPTSRNNNKENVIIMEDPFVNANYPSPSANQNKRTFARDWVGFFRRRGAAVDDNFGAGIDGKSPRKNPGRSKIFREHFDPRVTAKYDIKALIGKVWAKTPVTQTDMSNFQQKGSAGREQHAPLTHTLDDRLSFNPEWTIDRRCAAQPKPVTKNFNLLTDSRPSTSHMSVNLTKVQTDIGSFSRVVRVEHRVSGKQYAMKLLPASPKEKGPFENELSILSRVRHTHVIHLHEVFRTNTRIYMVLELATGGELYDRIISKGTFTEVESARTLKMLLDALQYLHRLGVTHRDLKPENLLYHNTTSDSRLLITDFGLASQQGSANPEDRIMTETCGTPEYIAPEVLMRFPYNNKFWSHISQLAKAFVSALLETDPTERLTAEESLRHPWLLAALRSGYQPLTSVPCTPVSIQSNLSKSNSTRTAANSPAKNVHNNGTFVVSTSPQKPERTRSNRSIRSVARSDHGHRVKREEVEKLSKDPEIKKLVFERASSRNSSVKSNAHLRSPRTGTEMKDSYKPSQHVNVIFVNGFQKDYGVV